ncbi:hypothetical protein DOY81_011221, partial [Sarcophaga bullata]
LLWLSSCNEKIKRENLNKEKYFENTTKNIHIPTTIYIIYLQHTHTHTHTY